MVTFQDLKLSPPVLRAIEALGFTSPTPIQAETLPILLGDATDFLGLAATGTGKTAAFAIPLIERIEATDRNIQALVLCPTRELALQVSGQVDLLGKFKRIQSLPIYGGASYGDQTRGLRQGPAVIVGTPGRIIDHITRGTLKLAGVKTIVLDEADEMISMGFKEDLEKILEAVPREESNIWLFSATMSREVRSVSDEYLRKPKVVQSNRTEMLPSTIEQYYFLTHEANKPEILCKLIDAYDNFYGLVFCQTKSLVTDLTRYMQERGYKVDCLHGDKDQKARERTMNDFREKNVSMLICTDVASRGLDVKDITHVINYSIPRELDNYVHRIGRTGRSGKTGIAMSLVSASNRRQIGLIERMTKSRMLEGKVPTRREIGAKKLARVMPKFQEQLNHLRAVEILDPAWKETIAAMTGEEIAGRFLAMLFPEIFNDNDRPQMARTAQPERDGGSFGGGFGGGSRSRAERPQRTARPERFDREGGGGRRMRAERPERTERPARAERPERTERPERAERDEKKTFAASATSTAHKPARAAQSDKTGWQKKVKPSAAGASRPKRFEGGDRPPTRR